MTWKSVTAEEVELCGQFTLWIRTVRDAGERYGRSVYGRDWLPSDADVCKSALFERIRNGLEPLDEPPPLGLSCPWYAVVEDAGPHYVFEVWCDGDEAIALQNRYIIFERRGEKDFIVGDKRGTSYRFRLWFDPDWRHPNERAAQMDRFQGGWFIQNAALASGMEARSGETEGLDPKDDSPTPKGDAQ